MELNILLANTDLEAAPKRARVVVRQASADGDIRAQRDKCGPDNGRIFGLPHFSLR